MFGSTILWDVCFHSIMVHFNLISQSLFNRKNYFCCAFKGLFHHFFKLSSIIRGVDSLWLKGIFSEKDTSLKILIPDQFNYTVIISILVFIYFYLFFSIIFKTFFIQGLIYGWFVASLFIWLVCSWRKCSAIMSIDIGWCRYLLSFYWF